MDESINMYLQENLFEGYAYHQIIQDQEGRPIDYLFLEVNKGFEEITGLRKEMLIGRRITEVLPGVNSSHFNWIEVYGQVALNCTSKTFQEYSSVLGKWFDVTAFSHKRGYFSTFFRDITLHKRMNDDIERILTLLRDQAKGSLTAFNSKAITQELIHLTGAKYALFITFNREKRLAKIQSIHGKPERLKRINQILQFAMEEKEWLMLPKKQEDIKSLELITYDSIYDFSYGYLSRFTASRLEQILHVKSLYAIAIPYGDEILGEFCLALTPGKKIDQPHFLKLFARLTGLMLKQWGTEVSLQRLEIGKGLSIGSGSSMKRGGKEQELL